MQTIWYSQKHIHPLFDDFDRIYALMSEQKAKSSGRLFEQNMDVALMPLQNIFAKYGVEKQIPFKNKLFTKLNLPQYEQKRIIVCFSGGKDSIAAVKHYLNAGYEVYFYHMRHINFALTDEWECAQELADYWKLPLYIDTIKMSGHHDYVEHPMKNMMICNGALEYGIREGIGTNIAFGNYKTSSLEDDNFFFCGGDCIETWKIYEDIIHRIIPDFKMNLVLEHLGQTLEEVCPDFDVMELSVSCIGRANLRKYQHDWVKKKYGIFLPPHRCGRCYKCCVEYIYMADHDLQDYNEDYYKYCLAKLKKNYDREDGVAYTPEEVWNHYMFYDVEESKYYSKTNA